MQLRQCLLHEKRRRNEKTNRNNLKLECSRQGRSNYEISGYLHSGSAIVYEGHIPAVYNQEDEE